ncbi:glycosyltransferase family 4 protein [Macrococcus brunensis]|uniref:glycosyltransferase family 4 protein n=1 Tax=Macrococcus brunensis TaxID=198483 RepID=UPI001EF0F79E|nr:glycosyltransferase family 4 protein [Macrococcus brunensis]ULG72701.1 glycosyltransferase family 4 protein [Macrococcus brunensis]
MKPKIIQVTAIGMSQIKLLSRLNHELRNNDYDVICVCSEDEYSEQIFKEGFKFYPVQIDRAINPLANLKSILAMYKVFKKEKPVIVHVHTPVAAVLGRVAAKLAGVPHIVYTAHGFYFHEGMTKRAYKIFFNIEKYIGRYFTDYIFTQSREDYQLARSSKFLRNNNYLYISNGIELDGQYDYKKINQTYIAQLRKELQIDNTDIVFSFLGRLVEEKGIFELLEAFDQLSEKYPHIKLICMGGLPSSERDKKSAQQLEYYKSNKAIKFIGQVYDAQNYYALSDIFILPSYREGMPRSIIEAMSMRNAIIATDIRGSREEVDDGINGLLVKVKNVEDLKNKMEILINDSTLVSKMKQAAFLKAYNEYHEKDVVQKQLNVFNNLLGRL